MEIIKKEVEFNGVKLTGIKTQDGKIYVIVKSFCEILGIDSSSQFKRIKRDEVLSQGVVIMTIPTESGKQETTLLELDYLPSWLTGIKGDRCKEEIRPYLKEFKLKAKDILAEAFFGEQKIHRNKLNSNEYNEEIKARLNESDKLENEIRKLCILLINEYDKISWRSSQSKERIEDIYKSLKGKKFMEDGKVLDFRAINDLNSQDYEIIKSKLDK